MEFEYEFTVLEGHLDTFGHMNHATYLQMFEQARWELVTSRGYGLKKVNETQIGPTILEVNVRYMRELLLREKVKIRTRSLGYKGKIGRIQQSMYKENGEEAAKIELVIALFDMKRRKLVDPTPDWLEAVGLKPKA